LPDARDEAPRHQARDRRVAAAASLVFVVFAAVLTGCDDDEEPQRLDSVTGPTHFREVCLGYQEGPTYTVGVADAEDTGTEPVTVTSADLSDTDGIVVDAVDLSVLDERAPLGEFGLWRGSPPLFRSDRAAQSLWQTRVPAEGATLPVSPARLNVVITLTGEADGTSGALKIAYENSDGDTGTWTTNVTYKMGDPCS
jgi:hypothetical protein